MDIRIIQDQQTNRNERVFYNQALKVSNTRLLIGGYFSGSTLDTTRYSSTVANGGTVAQANGKITIASTSTANGQATLKSVRAARLYPGKDNYFAASVALGDTGAVAITKYWGVIDAAGQNGFYFKLTTGASTFSICSLKGGVETAVAVSSMNCVSGVNISLDTSFHQYEIYYNAGAAYFFFDRNCIHRLEGAAALYANVSEFQLYASVISTGTTVSNIAISAWGVHCINEVNQVMDYYIIGSVSETRTLRTGGTKLAKVCVANKASGACTLSIYDALSATGTAIVIDLTAPGNYEFNIEFYTGLTYVCSAALSQNVVIIFE